MCADGPQPTLLFSAVPTEDFYIIELYDFSPSIKTSHLTDMFAACENKSGGFKIKWIDDTRALAIFESASIGMYPLSPLIHRQTTARAMVHPLTSNRVWLSSFLQPSKRSRPTLRAKSPSSDLTMVQTRILFGVRRVHPEERTMVQDLPKPTLWLEDWSTEHWVCA